MKFGMNLLLWTDDPTREEFFPVIASLAKMGYDGVELPVFHDNVEAFARLGRRLDDLGLRRTAVTVRTAADNPISADAAVRRLGVDATRRALDCCQAAGAELLAGPYYAALGTFSGAPPTPTEWAHGVESLQAVAEHAGKCGVKLAIEQLNRFEIYLLNTAADCARFVREIGHPGCGVLYDTFHSHIEEKSIRGALEACRAQLLHVHISENDRSTPGAGQVQWRETFDELARLGYDGWFTIEAFGQALPALAAATKIWRRMFVDEMQLARDGLAFMKREWASRTGG